MTKVHVDDLISWHVVGFSKLVTNWFVAKLYPLIIVTSVSYFFHLEAISQVAIDAENILWECTNFILGKPIDTRTTFLILRFLYKDEENNFDFSHSDKQKKLKRSIYFSIMIEA